MLSKTQKIRFSIMQATYWCSFASFMSFSIAYVRTKGISATYIGIMGAVYMLCAVAGQFFWGSICDRFQSNKAVFVLTNSLLIAVSFVFYFTYSPLFILLTYAALGFLQSPTASNLDTWILRNANNAFTEYGPIRAMGSLGFAIFIFFYGILISRKGYWVMLIFLTLFSAATIIIALTMPEKKTNSGMVTVNKINFSDIKALFSVKPYLFLLIILFFVGFSNTSILQNKILIWEYFHAPISYQGFDSSVSALFQVPFLFLTATLTAINVRLRLTVGICFTFIMLLVIYFAAMPQVVVAGDLINGIGYGLLLPSMREIIATSTSAKLSTTAQGIGDAVYSSLSGIMGSLLAGLVIDSFGVKTMVFICTIVFIIPLSLSLLTLIPKK